MCNKMNIKNKSKLILSLFMHFLPTCGIIRYAIYFRFIFGFNLHLKKKKKSCSMDFWGN